MDNLPAGFTKDIKERFNSNDLMIVSPDVGGVVRARLLAARLNSDLAIIDKRRERAGVSEVMHIIGDVEERECILIDDIVDLGRDSVQRCARADGSWSPFGMRIYHSWRPIGRRRCSCRRIALAKAGHYRQHCGNRSRSYFEQHRATDDRAADG